MAMTSVDDLLTEELRELLDAEKQAGRAYPKLMKAVASERLRKALDQHNDETKRQIERLEQVFEQLDVRPRGKACEAVRGLIEDAQDFVAKDLAPELLDVALVAAAQKMEHFEIAAYGSARAHAEALGLTEAARLLEETLEEEKAMDERLNAIALEEVNPKAVELAEREEEETAEADRAAAGNKPRRRKS
jgi:ferritin-like metal-binding protein YciE